jgi:glucose/mannose-6-phosphate isomerase
MDNNLDSLGIETALTLFPDQIKITYEQAISSNITPLDFETVVISGMGGSSNAGKIIASLLDYQKTNKQIVVYNGYGLPTWVNDKTLVVLNSYSGNTEETLSAYEVCKEKSCKVIGVTTGGKVGELITSGEIRGAIVNAGDTNPSGYPKSGLGLSFGALFGALTKVGLINSSKEELYKALDEVVSIRSSWNIKEIAKDVNGLFLVFFASNMFLGPMNAARNACCEIGRVYTQFYDFPEVNHVLIEALVLENAVKENRYIFFESSFDNERIKLRYKVTKELMDEMNAKYLSYQLTGSNYLVQALELAHFGSWLGFYSSILRGDDPGPEPWIIKLKEALNQPTH